jgi:hypothetical protein
MADGKYDGWALIVSVIALVVSGFALWDSHEVKELELAKANVQVQTQRALWDKSHSEIQLVYHNIGDIPITITHTDVRFLTLGLSGHPCYGDLAKMPSQGNDTLIPKEVAKNAGDILTVDIKSMPQSCANFSGTVLLGVDYLGVDSLFRKFKLDYGVEMKFE